MSRIPMDHPRTPFVRFTEWYSKRKYGEVLDPGKAALHNRKVLTTLMLTEGSAARWNSLDPTLQALAQMASSAAIGCSWCMDFGYWVSTNDGVPADKLQNVPT
jgi:alkylhydroperoxidase family enzyme